MGMNNDVRVSADMRNGSGSDVGVDTAANSDTGKGSTSGDPPYPSMPAHLECTVYPT
jgi:hypothetical protein